jgi:hypothetical protein
VSILKSLNFTFLKGLNYLVWKLYFIKAKRERERGRERERW